MKLDNENLDTTLLSIGEVDDYNIELPDFVEADYGEKLVLIANDEYSVNIVPLENLQRKINIIRESSVTSEKLLNDLYAAIIDTTVVESYKGLKKVFSVNFADNFLEDRNPVSGKKPVVFQNVNGTLRMYYSIEAFKASVNDKARKRG